MPSKNVYVSEALKRRMDQCEPVNWSDVFAAAVERELERQAAERGIDRLDQAVQVWVKRNEPALRRRVSRQVAQVAKRCTA